MTIDVGTPIHVYALIEDNKVDFRDSPAISVEFDELQFTKIQEAYYPYASVFYIGKFTYQEVYEEKKHIEYAKAKFPEVFV